jgi:predicted transposase YdaD
MSDRPGSAQPNLLDLSMKTLCRHAPAAMLRLAGVEVEPARVRLGDVTVVLPEFRADQVLLVGGDTEPEPWAVHFEYQALPDVRALRTWFVKNAALNHQLNRRVFLVVIYLLKGDRARFPSAYKTTEGPLVNNYTFNAVRLWEHADRIRRGELAELAPLLVLCDNEPTEGTIREELSLISRLPVAPEVRSDLLALAYTLGTRYFVRGVLDAMFKEELMSLRDLGIISEWIAESEARGRAEGEAQGRANEARRLTLRLLRNRFGELPASLVEEIGRLDPEGCEALLERAMQVETAPELLAEHDPGS